jgi:hypothetical protein
MARKGEEICDVDIQLIRETSKAWLVKSLNTEKEAFVPKSMSELEITSRSSSIGSITMPTWMAREKELI